MSVWALLQIVFNLILFAGVFALWLRLKRPPQDDPRLSRGLQLLQTKITVLEDLSDRTDNQVKQLTALLDQKTRSLQNKVLEAEQQIMKIDHSMNKSLEVAEIFQDKIPHQEIVERQQKVEYVRAARMAHSGLSVDEISAQVALPREQVELIAKFNREQLMFDEDRLPEWASRGLERDEGAGEFSLTDIDFVGNLEKPQPDLNQMAKIGQDFKQAIETVKQQEIEANQTLMDSKVAEHLRATMASSMQTMQPAVMSMRATAQTLKEKLVATAEELLRAQQQNSTIAPSPARPAQTFAATAFQDASGLDNQPIRPSELKSLMNSQPTVKKVEAPAPPVSRFGSPIRGDSAEVKRVVFPRIEK
ncbi:MAG: DUF2802 domain-containing protein [Bdellovibrionales bacterium]|nr:DUF2802 domain-containing protein [Bdellovibrionales bacterium]